MTFERAFSLTIGEEGGYSNQPADKGGVTYRGVTQARFLAWLQSHGEPDRDVITMTDTELRAIARDGYWDRAHCVECLERTGCFHFDAAWNHGPINAIRLLQEALGVEVDGAWGPQTQGAVEGADDASLLARYVEKRKDFYALIVAQDPTQAVFFTGWMNRIDHLVKALA